MNSPPLLTRIAGPVIAASAAVTSAVGGLGLVAYFQARAAASKPQERKLQHVVDGHVGPVGAGVPDPHRVVWIGDSLAAGLGAVSPDVSLPRLVAAHHDGPTRLHVFAEPGHHSGDVRWKQLPALEALRTGLAGIGQNIDAIGVSVGGNDIGAFTSRRRFRANLEAIIAAAENTPVVMLSIPNIGDAIRLPQPLRSLAARRARKLDRILRSVVSRHDHVHYASVRERPEWIRRADRAKFLALDGFHPSGAGYAIWADRVAAAFDAALKPTPAFRPA